MGAAEGAGEGVFKRSSSYFNPVGRSFAPRTAFKDLVLSREVFRVEDKRKH